MMLADETTASLHPSIVARLTEWDIPASSAWIITYF